MGGLEDIAPPLENREIMRRSRACLRGNWALAIGGSLFVHVLLSAAGAVPLLGLVGALCLSGPFFAGLAYFFLNLARGKEARFQDVFRGFENFAESLIAYLLALAYVLLWALLLVIPGIVAACAYCLVFFILADDPDKPGKQALAASKAMMDGHKWRFCLLTGRWTGWILLGILTCGIGFLWVIPMLLSSMAVFYDEVRAAYATREGEAKALPG